MEIDRAGSRPSRPGPAEWFTGEAWLEPFIAPRPPATLQGLRVTFAPRARTAWHTHPAGQALHVVSGVALVGRDDGTVERLTAGDSAWFAAGENHWHGASPDGPMVHLAIQQTGSDGAAADWGEPVSEGQYGA